MGAHYYLISRKRSHTNAVRIRDHIGQVIADKAFPPFVRGTAKMSKVDWWHASDVVARQQLAGWSNKSKEN